MENLSSTWIKKESSKQPGKLYFFNKRTGESSWRPPEGIKLENIPVVNKVRKEKLLKISERSGIRKPKTPAQDRLKNLRADLRKQQECGVNIVSERSTSKPTKLKCLKTLQIDLKQRQAIEINAINNQATKNVKTNKSENHKEASKSELTFEFDTTERITSYNSIIGNATNAHADTHQEEKTLKRPHDCESTNAFLKIPKLAMETNSKVPELLADNITKHKYKKIERNIPISKSEKASQFIHLTGGIKICSKKTPLKKRLNEDIQSSCKEQSVELNKPQNIENANQFRLGPITRPKSVNERLLNLRQQLTAQNKLICDNENSISITSAKNLTVKEYSPMEWENSPIEKQENEEIIEHRQNNATTEETIGEFYNAVTQNLLRIFSEKSMLTCIAHSQFCFVVDTNVLLRNLSFIEDLKKIIITDTDSPLIIVPYCVLQELDRIKMKLNQAVSTLAIRAIKYLNERLQSKDESLRGQSALEALRHLIEIENNDDNILNCCLQIKEKTNNILLITNDINLRNKAICNNILVSTKSDLESLDFNLT